MLNFFLFNHPSGYGLHFRVSVLVQEVLVKELRTALLLNFPEKWMDRSPNCHSSTPVTLILIFRGNVKNDKKVALLKKLPTTINLAHKNRSWESNFGGMLKSILEFR